MYGRILFHLFLTFFLTIEVLYFYIFMLLVHPSLPKPILILQGHGHFHFKGSGVKFLFGLLYHSLNPIHYLLTDSDTRVNNKNSC